MTNREMFEAVVNGNITEEVVAKAQEEIEKLDARNAARKEKTAEKRAENAPLIAKIKELLTSEPQLASDLAAKCELSTSKFTPLVKQVEGVIITDVKVKGKGTRKAYSI